MDVGWTAQSTAHGCFVIVWEFVVYGAPVCVCIVVCYKLIPVVGAKLWIDWETCNVFHTVNRLDELAVQLVPSQTIFWV